MLTIHVESGEEVIETVRKRLAEANVRSGAIASVIGAVDSCCISTMPKDDASKDILRDYAEPFELFGAGEVIDGTPHIHVTAGRDDGLALAGHLHWAKVGHWFVRVYVIPE